MTSMRSELGKIELNKIFQSRKDLNNRIRETLEETTLTWGISCDRYEILKIEPPNEVRKSMQLQAEAERTRRKDIILSEARKISDINIAEGKKQSEILKAEAEAESVEIKAQKEKEGLQLIAKQVMDGKNRGVRALDYILKRKYYDEYSNILRNGNVTVLPEAEAGQGSSDVLAAVAMMMNGNQGHRPRQSHDQHHQQATTQKLGDFEMPKSEERKTQPVHSDNRDQRKTNTRSKRSEEPNIDWNSISFFNNTNVDGRSR